MDVNRFAIESLLFFSATTLLSQLAKFIYISHPLTFPLYLAIKMAILVLAILIILKLKLRSEIGEIVILSTLVFIALG